MVSELTDKADDALDDALLEQITNYAFTSKVLIIVALAIMLLTSIFSILRAEKYKKLCGVGLLIIALIQASFAFAISNGTLDQFLF